MATYKQYTKKDGTKLWMFKTYLGIDAATGKQITTTRRNFKTKKEALLAENRLQLDFQENGLQKTDKTKYKDLYELWFETYKKTVKETTFLKTEIRFRLHILPYLGSLNIDKIDVKLCQKASNDWANKLSDFATVIRYASKIMKFAMNMDLIQKDPFDRIIKPKKKTTEKKGIKFYTKDQLEQMMKFLENRVSNSKELSPIDQYNPLLQFTIIRLLAFSGMRSGEAMALEWNDIDFEKGTVTVNKTLSATKQGFKVSSPKTRNSNRVIPLDPKTLRSLKQWQLKEKEILFTQGIKNNKYVFSRLNGKLVSRDNFYYVANRLAREANLPEIGLHGYRHTFASLLFSADVSMKEVQVLLGHSNIELTMNVYTHVTEQNTIETVEKLAKFANF